MVFGLQIDDGKLFDMDLLILKNELDKQHQIHDYMYLTMNDLESPMLSCPALRNVSATNIIPVGSIEFVRQYLGLHYGIKELNPIEVPDVLKREEFLLRNYNILSIDGLPNSGRYFVKNVSKLKDFTYTGDISHLHQENRFFDNCLYQVSEEVDIVSEYRCFVCNDEIISIVQYDGSPDVFPDVAALKKMVIMYMLDKDRPKAYTMDIAVIRDRGTALLEVHPFVSVGLYSYLFGSNLPYCYRYGLDYYKDINRPIATCQILYKK